MTAETPPLTREECAIRFVEDLIQRLAQESAGRQDWKARAEAAEATLAELRDYLKTYFAVHCNSTAASLEHARDLAEGARQIMDKVSLP